MHPQDMQNVCQSTHGHLYFVPQPTPPWEWLGGLQILQNFDPHIWLSVAWMEGISVYRLHPRHARPDICLHKMYEIYGTHQCPLVHYITPPIFLGMVWWFTCRSLRILVHLHWMVYDVPWTPTIHLGVDTTLNSSMGWHTIVQATKQGGHIHADHTTLQGWTSMDERKLAHF